MCSASSPPRHSFAANVGMSRCPGRDTSQRATLAASMGIPLVPSASSRRMSLPFTQSPAYPGGPFRHSFDTETHSREGISFSPEAHRRTSPHAVSCLPWRPLSTRSPALVDAQPPPSPMCSLALVDALPHPRLVLVHFTRAKSAVVVLSLNASPF